MLARRQPDLGDVGLLLATPGLRPQHFEIGWRGHDHESICPSPNHRWRNGREKGYRPIGTDGAKQLLGYEGLIGSDHNV